MTAIVVGPSEARDRGGYAAPVLPSDVAWSVIISVAAAAFVLIVPLVLYAGLQLVRRRPVQLWVVRGGLIALGILLGFLLLATNGTETPRLLTLVASAVLLVVVFLSRPRTAGAVLVAISLPWTMWWISFLADNAFAGRHWAMAEVLAALIPGIVTLLVGLFSFYAFGRAEAERNPTQPAGPAARAFGATGLALLGPKIFGMASQDLAAVLAMLAIALVTASLTRGRTFVEGAVITVAGVLLAWAACCVAFALARRPQDRRAWEAFTWLGEWELDRYVAVAGGPALPSRDDFRRWLKASPDDPKLGWIRTDLFVMEQEFDKARAAAEAMPVDTPSERLEREAAFASIDWYSGGPGDPTGLRAAVAEILPADGDERLRADVTLSAAEVRRLLATEDADPARPMREMRDRLGARADGILWSVLRRRLWSKFLTAALTIVLVVVALNSVLPLA
jgi:hypothetical protein